MKELVFCSESMQIGDLLSVPVDGAATVVMKSLEGCAISFERTQNTFVAFYGDMIHDSIKRRYTGNPELWYLTAVGREGEELGGGVKIVDVYSECKMVLSDGRIVRSKYLGSKRKKFVKNRSAYLKWRLMNKQPETVCEEWKEFDVFQEWYENNRPENHKKWALRSPYGYYSPTTCGFDTRTDLGLDGAVIEGALIKRSGLNPSA